MNDQIVKLKICCSCNELINDTKYNSCKKCYKYFKEGGKYTWCSKCGEPFEKPSIYGTCYTCYQSIKKANS